jgi:beta-phosphoglucomutase-like phosphatase (HAD superfamily)
MIRAVIFDFDGVLVDSEPLHFRALRDALLPEGIAIDAREYEEIYLAYDDHEAARIARERHGAPPDPDRVREVARRKAGLFLALLPEVSFYSGARELVRALACRHPLAIASGALSSEIHAVLHAGGLAEAFTAVVGADDVRLTKPHPQPYLEALARLQAVLPDLAAPECLVFEDSPPGIASGRAAGMHVIAVAHSYPPSRLQDAHRVIATLHSFDPLEIP